MDSYYVSDINPVEGAVPAATPGDGAPVAGASSGASEGALTVTQVLKKLEGKLKTFSATVIGEVSEFSDKPGYKAVYFTISDDSAALPCLMWKNDFSQCDVELRKGLLVEVSGYFSLYVAKGRMNFTVKRMRLAGEGDLRLKVAQLARKLQAEGLMDPERKKAIPRLPQRIGVVTSPRGKAIQDVLRTLRRRYPLATVVVAGIPVEGAVAPAEICRGLTLLDSQDCDVILLVRGGGSYEDLMPFNDEQVARTVHACRTPVITGIGHEPDTTIADMVSDRRASTPTAAAEAATEGADHLSSDLEAYGQRLGMALSRRLETAQLQVERWASRGIFQDAAGLFEGYRQDLDLTAQRLHHAIPDALNRDRARIALMAQSLKQDARSLLVPFEKGMQLSAAQLEALSPLAVLARGYSITWNQEGRVVSRTEQVEVGQAARIRVSDGEIDVRVEAIRPEQSEETQGGDR